MTVDKLLSDRRIEFSADRSIPWRDAVSAGRRMGAMTGGLVAGLALSAAMLLGETLRGQPSELIELERKTAAKLGLKTPPDDAPATISEQLVTHGGHLRSLDGSVRSEAEIRAHTLVN